MWESENIQQLAYSFACLFHNKHYYQILFVPAFYMGKMNGEIRQELPAIVHVTPTVMAGLEKKLSLSLTDHFFFFFIFFMSLILSITSPSSSILRSRAIL